MKKELTSLPHQRLYHSAPHLRYLIMTLITGMFMAAGILWIVYMAAWRFYNL